MTELSKKDQLYELIRANPFISQQDLASVLGLSRSAVAGYIAGLIRDRRVLGRAYVLPDNRPIVCLGAANLDRKLRSIATLKMGTSNPARQDESFGGVARNIAENLARLSAPVALITAIGDDSSGKALLAHAEAAGIDTRATLHLTGVCSGTYTAVLDDHGEMLLALADMALYDALTPAFLDTRQPQRAGGALIVADLNLPRETLRALLDDAARGAVPLVIVAVSQPKMAHLPDDLRGLRLLILNQGELETRIGALLKTDADFLAACRAIQAQGAQDVIVTRGATGVVYTTASGIAQLDAQAARIVDVTGAGDAFAAAVCWSLFQGSDDMTLACRRGLQLSAMTLACEETVCPYLTAEVLAEIPNPDALPGAQQPFNALYQD
ncbi:winged helix-turn-helix transcriptional regulator [Massilia violaceinigra]|uniref:Winged helix-turn-helix transcriptional regulator n=1 Tax=Massilia violaceinigra TaxID=2045208 RepID=A0ABY3ZY51_9BURK|nr:carbohydrate kinase [Massilia violaceinigra]UOD27385.1 winged helix-turn-helix transcriptional regulator [Massilia violaceinigra]